MSEPVFQTTFSGANTIEDQISTNGFTAVLSNVTLNPPINGFRFTTITSKLTLTLVENVTVECTDNQGPDTVLLQRASKLERYHYYSH